MARKKSLSSKLSRRDPTDEEMDASLAEFQSAHDRVAAIMGGALVEHTLVDAIKACLDDNSDTGALFYDDKAPFGTFYARIVAAKAFKMISAKEAEHLHIIRDIRNQFAHSVLCLDFTNEHIIAKCELLKEYPSWPDLKGNASGSRKDYQNACYTLTMNLLTATTQRLTELADRLRARTQKPFAASMNALFGRTGTGGPTLADLIAASLQDGDNNVPDNISPDQL